MGLLEETPKHSPQNAENSPALTSSSSGEDPAVGSALVIFTGSTRPAAEFLDSLMMLGIQGSRLSAIPSLTFRTTQLQTNGSVIRDLPVASKAENELELPTLIGECGFVIIPDVSWNTLNKVV